MKKLALVLIFVLAVAGFTMAQSFAPTTDVLGAHQNQGRGCAGCHAPHSGSFGSGHGGGTDAGNYALWGQDASPLYGKTVLFGDNGKFAETLPASLTAGGPEVSGILLCLSCHDGSLTPTNMMKNQSYEQLLGVLPGTYGSVAIPTLLGKDGTTGISGTVTGNYNNDHPVGLNATISDMSAYGLTFNGTKYNVPASTTPYGQFIASYGYPALAPGRWSQPFGVTAGKPYVVCTTCHNQHVMNVYTSSAASPIAGDGGGYYYETFFFVNGPYNPGADVSNGTAASTTQFCRQCHFGEANEANNAKGIKTTF